MQVKQNKRSHLLRLAVASGLAGKFAAIFLQILSMPVAAYALNADGFAEYAILSALLAWLMLSQFGLGSSLSILAGPSLAQGDMPTSTALFSSACWVSITACLLVILLVFSLKTFTALVSLDFVSLIVILSLFVLYMALTVVEGLQSAHQLIYKANIYTTIGSMITAGVVVATAVCCPEPLTILLAVNLPTLILRTLNAFNFLFERKAYVLNLKRPQFTYAPDLLRSGFTLMLGGTIANFLSHVLPVLVIGKYSSQVYFSTFVVVMNAVTLLSSLYGLINIPMLTAAGNAFAARDGSWLRSAFINSMIINFSGGIIIFLVLLFYGKELFVIWYPKIPNIEHRLIVAAAGYILLQAIDTTNYSFLCASRRLKAPNLLLLVKSALFATLLFFFISENPAEFPMALLFLSSLLITVPSLSYLIYRTFWMKLDVRQ